MTIQPGETHALPLRPMRLDEIRSAIECDLFSAGEEWKKAERDKFGWVAISCREALDWDGWTPFPGDKPGGPIL